MADRSDSPSSPSRHIATTADRSGSPSSPSRSIAPMDDRLDLGATIKDRANEIYKKVEDLKSIGGKNQDAILAACLNIACRLEDPPCIAKEICSVANGATENEIVQETKFIAEKLDIEMPTFNAGDLLTRFCSHLGMTTQAVKAAQEAVQKSTEIEIRNQKSIAAGVIYMITQLSGDKKPLEGAEISASFLYIAV